MVFLLVLLTFHLFAQVSSIPLDLGGTLWISFCNFLCNFISKYVSPVVSAFFWISRIEAVLNGSEFYIWVFCVAQAFLPKLSPMFFGKHKIQRFWNKFDLWFQWNISLYTPIVNKDSQIYSVFYVQWHRVLIGKPSSNQCKGTLNEILNIFDV